MPPNLDQYSPGLSASVSTVDRHSYFEPIAIVGVGMRAPGNINDFTSLWDTLVHRKSHHACLATDPRFLKRFNEKDFEAVFSTTPDSRETLHANLLEETPGLDEEYFGVSKRESACMDVQLKLLLHVAHEALEDAGFSGRKDRSAGDPDTFGVFIGSLSDDFCRDVNNRSIDIYHLVRNQRAFFAGQISHHFGLRGPSVSIDTACSGSMTAFNDACRAIATGECRAAIAGGVQVMTPFSMPPTTIALHQAGFLSTNGQCKPFLADGDGYCRAEACGLVVLKRLSDAVRGGDHIHGIIRGISVGNMASSQSITRPDGYLQSAILAKSLALAGVQPSQISFVEAHGPGTKQGDFAEIFSISSVLGQTRRKIDDPLIIGSIKGNIGHSEAASGALSLFKVLAMMRYGRLAPQAVFRTSDLNPTLRSFFEGRTIRISNRECEWNATRRLAVINNFGAAGYAGSMVIEGPLLVESSHQLERLKLPFVLSAKSQAAFDTLAHRYSSWLRSEGVSTPLSDISYTLAVRRVRHSFVTTVNASSHDELARRIMDASGRSLGLRHSTIVFCFSGQGNPRLNPRQSSLYGVSTEYTSTVDLCFQLSEARNLFAEDDIDVLELFALQMGLANMWCSWGLKPVAYAGHSFGEYAALVKAGVIALQDALKLLGIRAALIRRKCNEVTSRMAALHLPLLQVMELLKTQIKTKVELACINSDTHVTLAGTPQELLDFRIQTLMRHPTAGWRLIDNMKVAFHSIFMDPICEQLCNVAEGLRMNPSHSTVLSGLLGRTCLPGDPALLQPDYFSRHCREINLFSYAVRHYMKNLDSNLPAPDWLEIGPHSTTIGFVPLTGAQRKYPSHINGSSEWSTVMETLTSLCNGGHEIDFYSFHRDINPFARHVDIPKYPLNPLPHVYSIREHKSATTPMLQLVSSDILDLMRGHMIADLCICPASVYISMALASVNDQSRPSACRISQLKMTCPLTDLSIATLEVRLIPSTSTHEIKSRNGPLNATLQLHCTEEARLLENLQLLSALILPLRSLMSYPSTSVLDGRLVYDLFAKVVKYGPMFQGLRRIWIAENGYQGWGFIPNDSHVVQSRAESEPVCLRRVSPILVDLMYQLLGFLVNTSTAWESGKIFIATEISDIEMAWEAIRSSQSFECYASFELLDTPKSKNSAAVGQVFTFDHRKRLVAVFRGVRMLKISISSLDRVISESIDHPPVVSPRNISVHAHASTCSLEESIISIFKRALCVEQLDMDTQLVELGLDSLTAIEIRSLLHRLLPDRKLSSEIFTRPDVSLAKIFEVLRLNYTRIPQSLLAKTQTAGSFITSNPEIIQLEPGTIPLLLIHDGTGTCSAYHMLKDIGRTVLAIHSPGLYKKQGTGSIRDGGCSYGSVLRAWIKQHNYPACTRVLVGGWSLGGILALSLAVAHSDLVGGVILLDSPPPGTSSMTETEAQQLVPALSKPATDSVRQLLQVQLQLNSRALSEFQGEDKDLLYQSLDVPVCLISAQDPVPHSNQYDPTARNSCSQWLTRVDHALETKRSWKDALGEKLVVIQDTPGDHFSMFNVEQISTTSKSLQEVANELLGFFTSVRASASP